MGNPFDDFMADVDAMLNKPRKSIIDVLTDEEKEMLLAARKRGLSIEKITDLCEKHFNLKISTWTIKKFLSQTNKLRNIPT